MEIPIEKILEGYTIKAPERVIRQQIADVLEEIVGVRVDMAAISYQKGRIYVDTSPLVRSQIQIRKEEILERLSDRLDKKKVRDIN